MDREAGLDVAQAFPVGQLGEGHGPVFGLAPAHRETRKSGAKAHLDGDGAQLILGGLGGVGVDDTVFQVLVGDHRRRDGHAVDVEGNHLDFGESAAHAVGIDHRQAAPRRHRQRHDGIDAADLGREDGAGRFAGQFLKLFHREVKIGAADQLLDEDGGGADVGGGVNGGVVVEVLERDEFGRAELLDRVLRRQTPDVGIAAAARSEEGGAAGKILEHVQPDFHGPSPACAAPDSRRKSPTALARSRTAPPGM